MQSLLLAVAVLACPVGMGVMIMRGQSVDDATSEDLGWQEEFQALRAEVEQLKAQRAIDRTTGGQ